VAGPTRDEAIAVLEDGHEQVRLLASKLTDDEMTLPATIGGGDWSAKDLIGHLESWEGVALRALKEFQGEETPWVESPEGPFSGPGTEGVDAFNTRAVAEKQRSSLADVRAQADRTHAELIGTIRGLTDDQWTAKASYPTEMDRRGRLVTLLGSVLGAPQRPFGHAFAHLPDLRAYVESVRSVSHPPDGPGSGPTA
jgi:hypothetical protein